MNAPSDSSNSSNSASNSDNVLNSGSQTVQEFLVLLEKHTTPEEKIASGLEFMRNAISQEGSPRLRDFWEVREQIFPYFKENLNPAIRSRLWKTYIELTGEARRLREMVDEESAFVIEQIELAIQALEGEVGQWGELVAAQVIPSMEGEVIGKKGDLYSSMQKELYLLGTWASRLHALRKEVMKTAMKMRVKTKLFKQLSSLGDQVFPKRKELIDKMSQEFEQDIDRFLADHFLSDQIVGAPYYVLRDEVKALQKMASLFTLRSDVFHRTRQQLNDCWDRIREQEQKRREEKVAREASLKETMTQEQATAEAERARKQAEKKARREKVAEVQKAIVGLRKEAMSLEVDILAERLDRLDRELDGLVMTKIETGELEKQFRALRDIVAEKREQELLSSTENVLENLRLVLQQKKERRQAIKEIVDSFRKQLGESNLDFEQAIFLREWIEWEKERLEKVSAAIQDIEERMVE